MESFPSLVPAAGFVMALWLGAYLISTRSEDQTAVLGAASMFSLAMYFLHAVLCLHIPAVQAGFLWRRVLGWSVVPLFAFWFHAGISASGIKGKVWKRLLPLTYTVALGISVFWLLGKWTFTTSSLVPVELRLPLTAYEITASGASTAAWLAAGVDRAPARSMALISGLLGLGGVLLTPVRLPHLPVKIPLFAGEGLLILAVAWCGLLVGRTGLFVGKREVDRDMVLHLATSISLAFVYGATIALSTYFAVRLRFNPLALSTIAILGLAIVTHVLIDEIRSLWDRLFFPGLANLRFKLRAVANDLSRENRMVAVERLLESLKSITGARWAHLHLVKGPILGLPEHLGDLEDRAGGGEREVLRQPVYVGEHIAGELVVGGRADGKSYSQEERLWLALFASHISLFLCHEAVAREEIEQLEETLQRLKEIREEQLRLRSGIRELLAPVGLLRPDQVRRLLRLGSFPGRLGEIVSEENSGLSFLRSMEPQKAEYVLRKALEKAVEELRPAGEGPSLVDLRDRPVRKKRKVRLPGAWAEYYIAKLLLAGHTLEAIAEQLELSPRQVHHYLDRLAIRLASSLEVKLREISL
jgi:hypothetical protein